MTSISKTWVVQADSSVDPDSPIDTALMTAYRDNLVHLREWLGASFTAGAVQDHNHDGVNSSAIDTGVLIKNGSFEDGLVGWTSTLYTGGTIGVNTSNDMDGSAALAVTSTVLANGGGEVETSGFIPVTGSLRQVTISLALRASVANVSSKAEVIWFDDVKAQISVGTITSWADTPTTGLIQRTQFTPPSAARFFKVRLTGGVPSSGSSVGTVYFDGVKAEIGIETSIGATPLAGVGSYVLSWPGFAVSPGATIAGSDIIYSSTSGSAGASGSPAAGTWMCCGRVEGATQASIFRRVF